MSDSSQGPGWWLASDGKWYPPPTTTQPQWTPPAAPAGGAGGITPPPKKSRWPLYAVGGGVVLVAIIIIAVATSGSKKNKVTTAGQVVTTTAAKAAGSSTVALTTRPPTTASTAPPTTALPTTTPPPPTTIAPIALAGSGQTATAPFTVGQGLSIFHATCSCSANFAIEILDSSGQSKDVIVNVVGAYDGTIGEGLDAGSYTLKIDADGKWAVTVAQPGSVPGATLPQTYSGKGQQTVGPFNAGAAARLQAHNSGTSNFVVEVLNADGASQDVPFNQIGSFNGSTISNGLSGGPYYLKVDSDGTWTITVSAL